MKHFILSFLLLICSLSVLSQNRNYDQELVDLLFQLRFDEAIEHYEQNKNTYQPFTIDTYSLLTSVHLNNPESYFEQLPQYLDKYLGQYFNEEIIPFFKSIYFERGDEENGNKTVEVLDLYILNFNEQLKQRQKRYSLLTEDFEYDIYELAEYRNITLPSTPWHLMVIGWDFVEPISDFQRIDIDVVIDKDITTNHLIYISPFNAAFNGQQFYAGIQTNIGGFTTKEMTERGEGSKGGIFSRWSHDKTTPIGLDYVEMYEDGLCESAGYEGEFCSVRRPYEWVEGTYTISLVKEETIEFKDTPHSWVCLIITDKKDNSSTRIGRILFEGEKLEFINSNHAFVETYGFKDGYRNIPKASITFKRPMIGEENIVLTGLSAHQPVLAVEEPNGNTPNCAYVTSEGTDITVHISSDVKPQSDNEIHQAIWPNKMNLNEYR